MLSNQGVGLYALNNSDRILWSYTHTREEAQIPDNVHLFKEVLHYVLHSKEKRYLKAAARVYVGVNKSERNRHSYIAAKRMQRQTVKEIIILFHSISQPFVAKCEHGVLWFVGSAYMRIFVNLPS